MDIMRVAAIALLGAVALLFFKQYKPEWGIPLRLILGVALGGMILSAAKELLAFAELLAGNCDTVTGGMWQLILKALGISFVTEITSGVCRDSGEGTLASWVDMAGKMALLLLSLPLIREILTVARLLLGMT
ncbi:MAG: hypothetical protein E7661_03090 [Ruminococcaceae bacterium]|nr:hypothetical protein [Oscillospiraceae bacterium]